MDGCQCSDIQSLVKVFLKFKRIFDETHFILFSRQQQGFIVKRMAKVKAKVRVKAVNLKSIITNDNVFNKSLFNVNTREIIQEYSTFSQTIVLLFKGMANGDREKDKLRERKEKRKVIIQ